MAHVPVLLQETVAWLDPQPGEVFVDGTVGSGGHAIALASRLGRRGRLIGLDQDEAVLSGARIALAKTPCRTDLVVANFRDLSQVLTDLAVDGIDGLLLDLGIHSDQLEASGRGFSFLRDEPLLMTMVANPGPADLTARDVVNTWREENLALIIGGFGEERFARPIAKAIVAARREKAIETTGALVRIIERAVPKWYIHKRLHFATRTFQALRLVVNDELGALTTGLAAGWAALRSGGRLGVISFHSLESRLVKEFFRQRRREGHELLTKKAIQPSRAEILTNVRARSAELRVGRKIVL